MSKMVERVARAIYEAQIGTAVPDDLWPVALAQPAFKDTLDSAAAAVRALRDPTKEMLRAAAKIHRKEEDRLGAGVDCFLPLNCWRAMIDTALE